MNKLSDIEIRDASDGDMAQRGIGSTLLAASIVLHERHGFSLAGILKDVGFKHNRWVDSVIMQRALTKK